VRKVLTDEHADLVREAVSFLCQQIMEAEVSAQVGASLGEWAPEERSAQRNGYRGRRFDTRAGTLELVIVQLLLSPALGCGTANRFQLGWREFVRRKADASLRTRRRAFPSHR
jgi:Transposase, Mutator family